MLLLFRIGIPLIGVLIYFGSLGHGYALDDLFHVVDNPQARYLNFDNILRIFTSPVYPGDLYRPVFMLSFALTYPFSGNDPQLYHVTNVLLHGAVSLMLFELFRRFVALGIAGMAAILFAIAPIHLEAVANISGRSELLAALFGSAALLVLVREERTFLRSAFASLLFLLALFSKESAAVVIPLYLLLLTLRGRSGGEFDVQRVRSALIALTFTLTAYLGFRWNALGGSLLTSPAPSPVDNFLVTLPWGERLLNALVLLGDYVRLILYPVPLSSDYSYAKLVPIPGLWDPDTLLRLFFLLIPVMSIVIGAARNRPALTLFGAWFFVAFLVTSNAVVPIGTVFGERLAYLPSFGIFGIVAMLFGSLDSRVVRSIGFGLVAALYSLETIVVVPDWRNNDLLYTREIRISPESARTHLNYGVVLKARGKLVRSEWHLRKAMRIYPAYAQAAYALGSLEILRKNDPAAIDWLNKALSIEPGHLQSNNLLARLYLNRGAVDEAENRFRRMIQRDPSNVNALVGLYAVALIRGEEERLDEVESLLRIIDPLNEEMIRLKRQRKER